MAVVFLTTAHAQKEYYNIIAIDGNGVARLPNKPSLKLGDDSLQRRIKGLETDLKNHLMQSPSAKVMVYIHGGLTSLKKGLSENREIIYTMNNEDADTYPICINWETGLLRSYFQHLFLIRQGERHAVWGIISSPLMLSYDLGRGLVRMPIALYLQGVGDLNSVALESRWNSNFRRRNADSVYVALKADSIHPFHVSYADDVRSHGRKVGYTLRYWTLSPARYLVGLPFLDFFGTNSWSNMKRKTRTAFRNQNEYDVRHIRYSRDLLLHAQQSAGRGALYKYLSMLDTLLAHYPNAKVSIVGHSMGAIITNSILREFAHLNFENIVFMGAACSIDDFKTSVIPYMKVHTGTKFHNLMLHPTAEAQELYPFAPAGSLLEWIDNIFEPMSSFEDRTFGKHENCMVAAHIIPETMRDRVWLKTFGYAKDDRSPYTHGAFNNLDKQFRFWREEFWK